jgi:hypothetical protein
VFWMGLSMSAAMSAIGFSEPLLANLGKQSGKFVNVLPEGQVNERSFSFREEVILLGQKTQWYSIFSTVVELCLWSHSLVNLYLGCTSGA